MQLSFRRSSCHRAKDIKTKGGVQAYLGDMTYESSLRGDQILFLQHRGPPLAGEQAAHFPSPLYETLTTAVGSNDQALSLSISLFPSSLSADNFEIFKIG